MFAKFDSVKSLKTLIKFAAVALTSPATVSVAISLYPADPILRAVVSVAALILVEGCLLLGWEMLDQQGKNASMAQRWLYAGLTWVAYFSLFLIALNHNEGSAGMTFRLTLGVMLGYASVEAGLLAGIKREGQADCDILADWQVRRYARKLARKSAMADLDSTSRIRQLDRDTNEKLYSLLDKATQSRKLSKRQAFDKTLQILTDNPTANPSDIANQIGKSRQTVYDYFNELEAAGLLHRNGSINVID